jgi:ubiquinone/menaquinone biosynthesis C-methylase UbiE
MDPIKQNYDASIAKQHAVFQRHFSGVAGQAYRITHDTNDPLTRYARDRRLALVVAKLSESGLPALSEMSALVVCGGAGGEATYLRKSGFREVVNSDFSSEAVARSIERDPDVSSVVLNAQCIDLPDDSFDILLVQDGLHHLPRPVCGFNEMIRVAKRAVIVLEPHDGFVANFFGTTWETQGSTVNHVFRWNRSLFRQVTMSQLLQHHGKILVLRIWNHPAHIARIASIVRFKRLQVVLAKFIYTMLAPLNFWGNSFIGIVIKCQK